MNHLPRNNARRHRNPRKHLHRQRPALASQIVFSRIGTPTTLSIQQARQTARAICDGEEGNDDIDNQIDGEGSGPFIGAKAAEVVGGEEEGEDCLRENENGNGNGNQWHNDVSTRLLIKDLPEQQPRSTPLSSTMAS